MRKDHRSVALFLAALGLLISGCGVRNQPPPLIFVTATPSVVQPPPPTLTPLPVLPTATFTPEILPTLTPIVPAKPSVTPPPTATPILPKLEVFDQGGGAMEVTLFGPAVANKQMAFRAIVCNPDCKNNRPDGRDVDSVKFTFYKWNVNANQKGQKVYEHTESTAPYCSFGGSGRCDFIDLSDRNVKWPGTNLVIDNGEYYFEVTAAGKNNRKWNGNFRFKVQR